MKLTVNNFALIKHADVTIDGITVIAGDNNTGKSTIGKILFSAFHALKDIDEKIKELRKEAIIDKIFQTLQTNTQEKRIEFVRFRFSPKRFHIVNNFLETENYEILFEEIFSQITEIEQEAIKDELRTSIQDILDWPYEKLLHESIHTSFMGVFNGQINSLSSPELEAELELTIRGSKISINFEHNNSCSCETELQIMHNAIYYNNPHIIDALGGYSEPDDAPSEHLIELLDKYHSSMRDDKAILTRSMQKEKMADVLQRLSAIVPGDIVLESGSYSLRQKDWVSALSLKNLSSGVKAFTVLRMLIESNQIRQKDVLILDEPEIHLHPNWQLIYAELIVLLQKEFELSVVITTHSHFFLNAIHVYSAKHNTADKAHYYLSEITDSKAVLNEVTDNLEEIYKKMAEAVGTLKTERLEHL